MHQTTLFELLAKYDEVYKLKPLKIVENIEDGLNRRAYLRMDELRKYDMPVGKSYLMVSRKSTSHGMKYAFKVFKVKENYKDYVLGTTQAILERPGSVPPNINTTIDKRELVAQSSKSDEFTTVADDYVICEFPDIEKLKELAG